jgi:hypothetical protein
MQRGAEGRKQQAETGRRRPRAWLPYLPRYTPENEQEVEVDPHPEVRGLQRAEPLAGIDADVLDGGVHHGKRHGQPLRGTARESVMAVS